MNDCAAMDGLRCRDLLDLEAGFLVFEHEGAVVCWKIACHGVVWKNRTMEKCVRVVQRSSAATDLLSDSISSSNQNDSHWHS